MITDPYLAVFLYLTLVALTMLGIGVADVIRINRRSNR